MIKVENIYKNFGKKRVLCGVNLEVCSGQTVVIVGSSGVGKSILLKTLVGLIKPDSGSVTIDNVDITKCAPSDLQKIQKKIGYVFQEAALFDSLNIFENVAFGLRTLTNFDEQGIKNRVAKCLAMVGLKNVEHLKPANLSGGMKKRVAIARTISYKPNYILYDEPTTGLDPIMSDIISDLIISLKKGLNVVSSIVVTHDMNSAYKIADKIMMIYEGKIIFSGTPEEVKSTDNEYVQQFVKGSKYGPIQQTDKIFEME
ncbi:MAG: ABC transporter ATP-binding protein [Endomicrobium sp.]|jgi:phospholipid/cholesterol/gamma-HCH transport system ATP-binding protein|nr:ABC transporter ATP-binding protein [Endomicrobium sp.]